jgi:hypothetical protein
MSRAGPSCARSCSSRPVASSSSIWWPIT